MAILKFVDCFGRKDIVTGSHTFLMFDSTLSMTFIKFKISQVTNENRFFWLLAFIFNHYNVTHE